MLSFLAALPLMVVPPNVALPDGLELCIHKAEICALTQKLESCLELPASPATCVADYESCAQPFPEAGEPACRLDYVWCKLELGLDSPKWLWEACEKVEAACPTL